MSIKPVKDRLAAFRALAALPGVHVAGQPERIPVPEENRARQ